MAVTQRGDVQLAWNAAGALAWPAGTVAGDLAVIWSDWPLSGPGGGGWSYLNSATWWKRLTAADIAAGGPGVVAGKLRGLVVLAGSRGIGAVTSQRGAKVTEAGGGVLVEGWTDYWTKAVGLGPAANRLGSDIRGYQNQWCAWWLLVGVSTGYRAVDYDGDSMGYRAYELLPIKAPDAPTVIGPSGDVDITQPVTIHWAHNSDEDQALYQIRIRKSADSTWQYVQANGTLGGLAQIASSVQQATINAGLTSEALVYQVSTGNLGSLTSDWSALTTIIPVTPPSVVPVLTTTPESTAVAVSWSSTTPRGLQTAWQAAVAPAGATPAQAVWTSPVTAGTSTATQSPPLATWTNGGSYQAWVRVQQTGGTWSQWTPSTVKTVSWTPPTAPTSITVTDGSPLTITVGGIVSTASILEVQSSPDGVEWSTVRRMDLPNAVETVPNPLAAYDVPTRYRARILAPSAEGVDLPSAWITAVAPVASTDVDAYLVDCDDWLRVTVTASGQRAVAQGLSVTYGLGASGPSVDRTPTAGQTGTTTVRVDDVLSREILIDWLTTRDSWWLRWSPEVGKADYPARHGEPPTRMALSAQVQISRWAVFYQAREITWSWVEVKET